MISRRQALVLAAGLGLTRRSVGSEASWTRTPEGLLYALMKLRAALDNRITIEWFQGVAYAVVNSAMLPLFTVNAVAFAHYRQFADGSYRGKRAEVTFHTALNSSETLKSFRNPLTGKIIDVPALRTPNQHAHINSTGLVAPPSTGSLRIESVPSLGPGIENGERSWVRLDTRTRIFVGDDSTPTTTYGESISYAGRSADIHDRNILSAPCQISYVNVMNWRPWLGMGAREGHTTTIASGEKVETLEQVPALHRDFVQRHHPDLADDPRIALER